VYKRQAALLAAAVVAAAAAATGPEARPGAFLSFTYSPRTDGENAQYFACIARADGTKRMRIVSGSLSASAPSWNRDGSRVAFTGWNLPAPFTTGHRTDVVVADAQGRLLANLTAGFAQSNFNPKWSPDGRWIAFISSVLELTIVRSDGSQPAVVIPVDDFDGSFDWFPDGKRLAVSTFQWLVRVNIDGSGLKRLVRNGSDPSVSPDGRKLAYDLLEPKGRDNFEIYVANADGSKPRRFTHTKTIERDPAWSPGGKWLAFERVPDPQAFFRHTTIVVARADGKASYVAVKKSNRYDPFYPSWRRGVPLPDATRSSC
jgi:Tol biopolymer transport system component